MRPLMLASLLLLLAAPAAAQTVNDSDIGAKVVFRTPPPPAEPSVRVEAVTQQNSYPFPVVRVFLRFGFDLDDATIHLNIPADGPPVDGDRHWQRVIQGLAATGSPEVVIVGIDTVGGVIGRAIAPCVQETERRLVCRGGPQP